MPVVAITVDCEAANAGKCYTRELVRVAEEHTVPLTWFIFVSEKDPMSNVMLYHTEYMHRIPSWHEIGLLLSFENSAGYISDPKERADLIRIGKDVLKQCHVKATAFRAHRFDLLADDLPALIDIGILVDASATPGAKDKHNVAWKSGHGQPYHPSETDLSSEGRSPLLMAPIATSGGIAAYLDAGWDKAGPVVEKSLKQNEVTVVALSDTCDCMESLQNTIKLGKSAGARFVTLTQLAAM